MILYIHASFLRGWKRDLEINFVPRRVKTRVSYFRLTKRVKMKC